MLLLQLCGFITLSTFIVRIAIGIKQNVKSRGIPSELCVCEVMNGLFMGVCGRPESGIPEQLIPFQTEIFRVYNL